MPRHPRPERIAFLDDVKDNPDDPTPWLVLADWLEENGDEPDRARAEHVRLCHEFLGKKVYASDYQKGERRRELFRTWRAAWLGPLLSERFQLRRGLLFVATSAAALLGMAEDGRLDAETG